MLYIVLLVTQVTCEWVEISQNYHRINSFRNGSNNREETGVNIYSNSSIPEPQWNKGVIDRIANVGNIKKVPFVSVKSPSIQEKSNNINFGPQTFFNSPTEKHEPNTMIPMKSGTFASSPSSETDIIQFQSNIKNRKLTADNSKINFEDDMTHTISSDSDEAYKWVYVRTESPKIVNLNSRQLINNRKYMPPQADNFEGKYVRRNNITNIHEDLKFDRFKKFNDAVKLGYAHNYNRNAEDALDISKTDTESSVQTESNASEESAHFRRTNEIKVDKKNRIEPLDFINDHKDLSEFPDNVSRREKDTLDNYDLPKAKPEVKINSTKTNSMESILKMVTTIVDIISKNTKLGFKGKVNYLEKLKNTILATIEERIDSAWPDDAPENARTARSTRAGRAPQQARGLVNFPSSESALMTISFLTFAVFLIKLVLQVVHAYKNKAMMVTPAVVAAVGRAAEAIKNKK